MSFTLVTLSGTFLVSDDLSPARGVVTFRLSHPMQDTGNNQIVSADRRAVRLDAAGSFSISLPANDDPTTQPTGVTYEVEELIEDSPRRSYAITLVRTQPSVNLADLAPAVPGPQLFGYALVGHAHTLDSLSDVFVPAPADTQVVTWVAANSRWEAASAGAASHPNLATHDALGLATDAELAAHAAAGDPHPVYETSAEAAAKVTAHEGAADPHPTYETSAEAAAKVTAHEAAADPHTGYQRESEKGAANGYASLDAGSTVPDAQIPAAIARDAEVTAAVAAHAGAGDPHPAYATDTDLSNHAAAADPHTGYQRESEKGQANGYASLDAGSTVPDAQIPAAIARDAEVTTAVSNHAGAADPHTGYQKESEKGAATGYASLGADTLVPQDQLGTGTQDGTRFLRDDGTWQSVPSGYTDEQAQDAVGAMLLDTATIDLTYVDATPALSADVKAGSITTGMLAFDPATQAELDAAVAAAVNDGDAAGGDLSGTYPNPSVVDNSHAHDTSSISALDGADITTGTVAEARIDAAIARDTEVSSAITTSEAGQVRDGDAAGGVLSGTYPNPGFAVDMATQAELDAHAAAADPHTGYVQESLIDAAGDLIYGTADNAVGRLPIGGSSGMRLVVDGGLPAWGVPTPAVFASIGTLSVRTGTARFVALMACKIAGARAVVNTAPTGASVILDVNKNGTTIFSTQANRPAIAAGTNDSGAMVTPNTTTLAAGDYLTVDIDQVGSGTPGADLTVEVVVY